LLAGGEEWARCAIAGARLEGQINEASGQKHMHLLSRDGSEPSNSTLAAIDSITGILDFLPSLKENWFLLFSN